jgi:tRNA pseudouridine38-40 synthase
MQQAARRLEGVHDFAAFATNSGTPRLSTVRDLRQLELFRRGTHLTIRATADGFLYHMVRNLTGALVKVGKGKMAPGGIEALLKGKKRELAPAAAPSFGLYLDRVVYFPKATRLERARRRQARRERLPDDAQE